MKKTVLYIFFMIFGFTAFSQGDFGRVLSMVEKNNPVLKTLRSQIEAGKVENRSENTLENPEVEVGYLWGTPSAIGNRTDFSISQTFDFPTLYLSRKKLISLKDNSLELQYASERLNVLMETQRNCAELVFHNALVELYGSKLRMAQDLHAAYRKKFESGEVSILDFNKAEFEYVSLKASYDESVLHRNALLSDLAVLNGGDTVDFGLSVYEFVPIDENFERWYSGIENKIPGLQLEENALQLERQQLKVAKSNWLPQISIGYVSEREVEERFQGLTIGISLPLWSNARNVRSQKMRLQAVDNQYQSVRIQYYGELKKVHARAVGLQRNMDEMQKTILNCNTTELLQKAFEAGEISLLTYIQEQNFYMDISVRFLEIQRDAMLAALELRAMEL